MKKTKITSAGRDFSDPEKQNDQEGNRIFNENTNPDEKEDSLNYTVLNPATLISIL